MPILNRPVMEYLIDLLKGGRYRSDLMLAATLAQNGAAAWDWLAAHGCQFPGPEGLHVQHDHSMARSVKLLKPGMIVPLKQAASLKRTSSVTWHDVRFWLTRRYG